MTDDVRGIIIGDACSLYEFWTTKSDGYPTYNRPYRFARMSFTSDKDAEEWVKNNYPEKYKDGVEMRVFEY